MIKIRFIPRNIGCWRVDNNSIMFEYVDFMNKKALELFISRFFYYSEEYKPELHFNNGVVKYGTVVGYYKEIES